MARRRHLIAYDIADPARLRRVAQVMEAFGERLQYSVFLCDLSRGEFAAWRLAIMDAVHLGEDSIIVLDLGLPGSESLLTIGAPRNLPSSGPRIV